MVKVGGVFGVVSLWRGMVCGGAAGEADTLEHRQFLVSVPDDHRVWAGV